MNSKVALLLGFIIGIAAGVCGMYLSSRSNQPAPAYTAAKEVVAIVVTNEKKSRASWWDIDAPTPDLPVPRQLRARPGSTPSNATAADNVSDFPPRDADAGNLTDEQRQQRYANFWSNQMTVARANFVSSAVLTEDEATRFDVLAAAMNLRLSQRLDPVIEQYLNGWRPSPEERTRLMMDVSQIIVATYDEMDRNMPAGWRDAVTNAYFSLTQFVDPQYMPFTRGMGGFHGSFGSMSPPPPPPAAAASR